MQARSQDVIRPAAPVIALLARQEITKIPVFTRLSCYKSVALHPSREGGFSPKPTFLIGVVRLDGKRKKRPKSGA